MCEILNSKGFLLIEFFVFAVAPLIGLGIFFYLNRNADYCDES